MVDKGDALNRFFIFAISVFSIVASIFVVLGIILVIRYLCRKNKRKVPVSSIEVKSKFDFIKGAVSSRENEKIPVNTDEKSLEAFDTPYKEEIIPIVPDAKRTLSIS